MQDHYVGDIRDFAKYGLLRWLCRPGTDGEKAPNLGVVWYRVRHQEVDKGKKAGGSLDAYLTDPGYAELRACDEDLIAKLKPIRAKRNRTVFDVDGRVLPACGTFFSAFWTLPSRGTLTERRKARERVSRRALDMANECKCEVLFLDPDNGIHTGRLKGSSASVRNLKYVLPCELRDFYADGERSVVLIQFLNRWRNAGSPAQQINNRRSNLRDALQTVRDNDIRTLLFCFRGCSDGARVNPGNGPPLVFFILPGSGHETWIDGRLSKLAAHEHWGRFVSLGGGSKPKGVAPGLCRRCDACEA